MVVAQVDGEIAQGIEDGHVQLIVLLGAEAAGAQFGDEGRAAGTYVQWGALAKGAMVGRGSLPALERVHQLPRSLQAPPHEHRLLAHDAQSILQQARLVFHRRRRRHCCDRGGMVACSGRVLS